MTDYSFIFVLINGIIAYLVEGNKSHVNLSLLDRRPKSEVRSGSTSYFGLRSSDDQKHIFVLIFNISTTLAVVPH